MQIKELGHVVLYVSDLERSANFYKNTLGFREISRGGGTALFSSGRTHHELLLIEIGGEPRQKNFPEVGFARRSSLPRRAKVGLYHIGFKIGDSPDDARKAYGELVEKGVTIVGTGDHYITHSIYILDPDLNELELYADVNNEWKKDPSSILKPVKSLNLE